jgi:hypothetical protein
MPKNGLKIKRIKGRFSVETPEHDPPFQILVEHYVGQLDRIGRMLPSVGMRDRADGEAIEAYRSLKKLFDRIEKLGPVVVVRGQP